MPSNGKYNIIRYIWGDPVDYLYIYPISIINVDLTSIFAVKHISPDRALLVGTSLSFTKADSSLLTFSHKLGVIHDINTASSPYTCDGLSQPIFSYTTSYSGGKLSRSPPTSSFYSYTLSISTITQSDSPLIPTDIRDTIESSAVEEFEEVCLINDLGNDKTYKESGVTSFDYYFPGPTVSATFETVSLVCLDGSVFTTLDVWEEETQASLPFIDISSETFTLNVANWLADLTEYANLNACRNHDGVSRFKVRKDYTLTMKYC